MKKTIIFFLLATSNFLLSEETLVNPAFFNIPDSIKFDYVQKTEIADASGKHADKYACSINFRFYDKAFFLAELCEKNAYGNKNLSRALWKNGIFKKLDELEYGGTKDFTGELSGLPNVLGYAPNPIKYLFYSCLTPDFTPEGYRLYKDILQDAIKQKTASFREEKNFIVVSFSIGNEEYEFIFDKSNMLPAAINTYLSGNEDFYAHTTFREYVFKEGYFVPLSIKFEQKFKSLQVFEIKIAEETIKFNQDMDEEIAFPAETFVYDTINNRNYIVTEVANIANKEDFIVGILEKNLKNSEKQKEEK